MKKNSHRPRIRGGEQAPQGALHTTAFSEKVGLFGWNAHSPQDRNFPCGVCAKLKNGNHNGHGVDLLFTIACPYSGKPRGIYVDGKRYEFKNVTSIKALKGWIDDAKKVTIHLDRSQDLFRDQLSLPQDLIIDTGIVAWDPQGEWDEVKAREDRKAISYAGSDEPPVQVVFLTKPHLDRLETVSNFREKCEVFDFLYIISGVAKWSATLTPEMIASNWWPIRYRRANAPNITTAILCFDMIEPSDLKFIIPMLTYLQLTPLPEIEIHLPDTYSDIAEFSSYLQTATKERNLDTKLQCKKLPFVPYKS